MDATTTASTTIPDSRAHLRSPAAATVAFLAAGPLATVLALLWLERVGALGMPLHQYVYVALLFWSPLPFSIPAVVLESHRDATMPLARGFGRVLRAIALIPAMLAGGKARVATAASVAGFAVALVATVAMPALRG